MRDDATQHQIDGSEVPLTRQQAQLFIAWQLDPDDRSLIIQRTSRIFGEFDVDRFAAAFAALVRDTDALRAVVVPGRAGAAPAMHFDANRRVPLERVDLSACADPHQAYRDWLTARAARSIDPTRCMVDTALVRRGATDHVWYLALHHLIIDGYGCLVLFERLSRQYAGAGEPAPTAPRFADALRAEQVIERSEAWADDRDWWIAQLDQPAEPLCFDGTQVARRSFAARRVAFRLGAERMARLRRHGSEARRDTSAERAIHDLLFAAYLALLHRLTGAPHLTVGVPLLHRPGPAERDTVGLFMRVVPVRVAVAPHLTLRELQDAARAATAAAAQHRRFAVGNPRGRIFEVSFNVHARELPAFAGMPTRHRWLFPGVSPLVLVLHVRHLHRQNPLLYLELADEVLPPGSEQRFIARLRRCVDALLDQPDRRLQDLDLLEQDERARLLQLARGPRLPPPAAATLVDAFLAQVARTPQAIALIEDEVRITYAALAAFANRVTHALLARSVRRGEPVALLLPRSIDMVAAQLGAMAAGAAFLPIDPRLPARRIEVLLQDSGARWLISRDPTPRASTSVLDISRLRGEPDAPPAPRAAISADDAAWMLYTSGSTGPPNGVIGTHRGAVNRARAGHAHLPWQEDDVACHKTWPGFVDAIEETFGALLAGVPAVIADDAAAADPRALLDLLEAHAVTRVVAVPALLRALLALDGHGGRALADRLRRLRLLLSSGEELTLELARALQQALPHVRLWNVYGSTEVAADATWFDLAELRADATRVPLGRPLPDVAVYVLDAGGQIVPPGSPGEIWVGGVGVALGYHQRAALDACRFARDPFADQLTARMFRTGDRGRWSDQGQLEFLGRLDDQLRVRGVRIEPGEIEATLLEHRGVAAAAVAKDAHERLFALIVPRAGAPIDPAGLRTFLRDRLPAAMIPARLVGVDALPRLPGGKLDRRALATWPLAEAAGEEPAAAATADPLHDELVWLFQRLTRTTRVSAADDFFALGGDSLQAVELLLEIERRCGRALPLDALFAEPTIAGITALLRAATRAAPATHCLVRIADGPAPPLFCVPPGGSSVACFEQLASHLAASLAVYAFAPRGLRSGEAPHTSVEAMADDYVRELREVQPHGPYRLAGRCMGGLVALEIGRRLLATGERVELLAVIDTQRPPGVPQQAVRRSLLERFRGRFRRTRRDLRAALAGELARRREVARAHRRARRDYRGALFDGRIVLIHTGEEQRPSLVQARWADFAAGGVETVWIAGHHSTLLREPRVREVAAAIVGHLR